MCIGKDVVRWVPALLVGLAYVGCASNGGRRPSLAQRSPAPGQPSARGSSAPISEARPVRVTAPTPVSTNTQPSTLPPLEPPPPPIVPAGEQPVVTPPADPLGEVRRLHRAASERYAGLESYIARLRRREQVGGKDGPEEVMIFKFRKQPWSVHFKWLADPGKGREVVYVRGQHGDNIQTLTAAGDIPLMQAGFRIALAPNDPKVLARSRYPITEAGIGALVDRLGSVLGALDRGDPRAGKLTYLGPQPRPEFPAPLEAVEHIIPSGAEGPLPQGGRRLYCFDGHSGLPVLALTRDEKGREVEYYCYDRFLFDVRLDDDDFNPDKLWPRK